jgi:RNA polymerase sigma-70 factor (ECF subfamily)
MFAALMPTAANTPSIAENPASGVREMAAELRPIVRAVVAAVLRESPDHADVEDCTNETLRRALESPTSVRGPVRPWLLGVARHVAVDAIRARQRRRAREVHSSKEESESAPNLIDRLVDPTADADEQIGLAQRAARVRHVLTQLPDGPRQALELFHMEDLPYQEIATRLGVPLGTVATWVARGRKAMAEALTEESVLPTRNRVGEGKATR